LTAAEEDDFTNVTILGCGLTLLSSASVPFRAADVQQASCCRSRAGVDPMAETFVTVTGLIRATPAEYEAQWNGRPLRIILDTGATLKLLGDAPSSEKATVLSMKGDIVARAAERLIDMRIEQPRSDKAVVTVSALDLEPGASASPYATRDLRGSAMAAGPAAAMPRARAM
jgi:hypothetical protein